MLNNDLNKISVEDFNFLIKNGNRSSKLLNFDFESLIHSSWEIVKEKIPYFFGINDYEGIIYEMFLDRKFYVFKNDVEKIDLKSAMAFILWLIDELKSISEIESNYLRSDPDIKLLQAGINKLDQFGVINTLDNLAKGDILKYDLIRELPYNVVFDKQYLEVTKSEIEKKLSKIK